MIEKIELIDAELDTVSVPTAATTTAPASTTSTIITPSPSRGCPFGSGRFPARSCRSKSRMHPSLG